MKFTEGYWLTSERANSVSAAEAYKIEKIPGGMRVLATTKEIKSRGNTLNLPTITILFQACTDHTIKVEAWHYQGYQDASLEFEKAEMKMEPEVTITEDGAVMDTGCVQVRVQKYPFCYRFEADGRVITSCGFKNLTYARWDRKPSTMFGEDTYLSSAYTPYMKTELSLQVGECVYGLGERFTSFVKNGQVVETWNEDGGTASQVAYKSIPFYMTNQGYGVLVDSTDAVSFEVASEKVEYVGFSVPGEKLSYYFFHGPDPKKVMEEYTGLTGRPALPPAWSFGLWLSTSFTTNYDEETTSSFINGMRDREIPLSVFHFDCFWMEEFHWCDFEWDRRFFPDIKKTIQKYHDMGLRICVWINPYIAQGTSFFQEGMEHGYLLKRADGRGVWQTDHWQAGMGLVDFTNPEAVKWYTDKLRTLLKCGVDCFKTDFGERIPIDVVYYDGSNPKAMHNYYSYLYNKAVFELLETERGTNEAVLFARSATVGGQKFPVHWGGDCSANYPSMAETLRGGLSFAMSGFSFWSHDISGFESTATPDLYKRWAAFGLLSTHSRLHGSSSYRVPWMFDEEADRVVRFFTELKCRLMPYIYQKAVEAHETGTPVMRPMVFEFMEDPAVPYLDQQYMLGDALLVAPVFREDHMASYYLPWGIWTHLLDGTTKEGGRWYQEGYDYFSLPLFVRENTMLAWGSRGDRPDYSYEKQVEIRIYQLLDGKQCDTVISDIHGTPVLHVSATRSKNQILISVEESHEDLTVVVYEGEEKKIGCLEAEKNSLTILL